MNGICVRISCESGWELVDGKCIIKKIVCKEGYHKVGLDNCEKDIIKCSPSFEAVDG